MIEWGLYMTYILKGGYIVSPRGVFKGNLIIEDGIIRDLGPNTDGKGQVYDVEGLYLLPGFREQHMHDMPGLMHHADSPERIGEVARKLLKHGVTSFKLASVAMPLEDHLTYLNSCREYMESKDDEGGARFEGVFVEGTFINRGCAGAQPPEYIVHPDKPEARRVLDILLDTGVVRLINIVPDFGVDLIRYASSRGVIVGCGHCRASARQLKKAFEAGLKFIVHITNGSMWQSFKPFEGGGTYEGALTLPLFIEMITDGYHIDFRYVSDIIERLIQKGRMHDIIVVTDRLFPSPEDAPEGSFRMFSVICRKAECENVLYADGYITADGKFVKSPPYVLCGSLLTMDRAFQNLLNLLTTDHSGYMIDVKARSLEESLLLLSNFTSGNSARLEGLSDLGVLDRGMRADITVLEIDGDPGEYEVKIRYVMVDGRLFEIG